MSFTEHTEPTFTKKFSLTLTVEGASLDDIDNGLVAAAGERLQARMREKIKVNGEPIVGGDSQSRVVAAATALSKIEEPFGSTPPGRRGPKPGAKRGPYAKKTPDKKEEETIDERESEQAVARAPEPEISEPAASEETQDDSPPVEQHATEVAGAIGTAVPSATLNDAVEALKLVNAKLNVDQARAALGHFGVGRCSELTDTNRGQFVAYCRELVKGK